jgi:hypothetical protein
LLPAITNIVDKVTPLVAWMNKLDASTKTNIVVWGSLAIGLSAGVIALGAVVRAIQTVVVALRAMTLAQTIATAMAGPKGWAILAAGALVAVGAVAGVAMMFDNATKSATATHVEAKKVAEAVKAIPVVPGVKFEGVAKDISEAGFAARQTEDAIKRLNDMLDRGAELTKEMRTPGEEFADRASELNGLLSIGAISAETFRRAMADGASKAMEAKGTLEAMRRGPGGAVSLNTVAGFSAVQSSLREASAQREADRQLQLTVPKEAATQELVAETKTQTKAILDLSSTLLAEKLEPEEISFSVANF